MPETKLLSLEPKNATVLAISSAVPVRPPPFSKW